MTDAFGLDLADADAIVAQRDEVAAAVRDHAGQLAYALARIQGGDYGQQSFTTEAGEWTIKHEKGDIEYLRFSPKSGDDVYVVSAKQDPEPTALARAMADYDAFVAAFDDYLASLDGTLDAVPTAFPDVRSADPVVAERDRIVDAIREVCDRIARELQRYEGGDYGTFTTRVGGDRWELNWDADGASYLRVGGSNGVYILSQYGPPSVSDLQNHAGAFPAFVEAYNEHVAEAGGDLGDIEV